MEAAVFVTEIGIVELSLEYKWFKLVFSTTISYTKYKLHEHKYHSHDDRISFEHRTILQLKDKCFPE